MDAVADDTIVSLPTGVSGTELTEGAEASEPAVDGLDVAAGRCP
jgi:hypothetical protein